MSNSIGKLFKLTIFGESHSPGIGLVLEGLSPGFEPDWDLVKNDLARRRPGGHLASPRKEDDEIEIMSGMVDGRATGAPLAILIRNKDYRRKDYDKVKDLARPSHVDWPAYVKYKGFNDHSGSSQFSARLTCPLVVAGSLARQVLKDQGIEVRSRIQSIYKIEDKALNYDRLSLADLDLLDPSFGVLDPDQGQKMKEAIKKAREDKDSLGGRVEVFAFGLPVGLGEPLYDSLESRISSYVFSIPGVRSIEFGLGQAAKDMKGSDHNDPYIIEEGRVKTKTNKHGGIIGGMATGMPLIFRSSLKPTASIGKSQDTVNMKTMEEARLDLSGRHDPCIVPRSLVIFESVTNLAILDLMLLGGFI